MKLTKDDLAAIQAIVNGSIDQHVPKIIDERVSAIVQPMLDQLEGRLMHEIGELMKDTADGFNEVDEKFQQVHVRLDSMDERLGTVENTVGRIELQQRAHLEQLDDHVLRMRRLEKRAKLAPA